MHIPEGRRLHLAAAIRSSIFTLYAMALCLPAAAADTLAEEDASETVTVTGSRIVRSDSVTNSPVVSLDSEEIARSGNVNVEQLVRELPQAVAGVSSGVNLGNPGVATLNLRNLGAERTLVLVDGKRFTPYDAGGIVDVNNIPISLLERVDVVTGGASTVYGSDAMAGVVNFILKKDFEGLELRTNFFQTEAGDGNTKDIALTAGGNFADGRGNAVFFLGWTDREAVLASDRGFSEFALATSSGERAGSSVDTQGTLFCFPACSLPGGSAGGDFFVSFTPEGDLVPTGSRTFNYNRYVLLQVPQERVQGTALLRYDVNDAVEGYGRFNFAQTKIDTINAPSGTFFTREFDIPLDSPFLSAQARQVLSSRDPDDFEFLGRRTIEVGAREIHNRTVAYQALAGLRGKLWSDWNWDLSYQYGRTELTRIYSNDIDQDRMQASIAGCPSGSPAGCVAGNFFGDGNLSEAAAQFISLQVNDAIYSDQQVLMATLSGQLGEALRIPGASAVGVAFGAEYRKEMSESFPDDCLSTSGCSGGYGTVLPVRNEYDVKELFGELLVPLLEDRPFAHRLNFETGLRLSDYSTADRTHAFKAGGDWAPLSSSWRLRALYQKAVRAPNIFEFGSPRQQNRAGVSGSDPCSGTVSASLRELCLGTGVPDDAFTGNNSSVPDFIAGQINVFQGGNPDLEEEDSDTVTAGFVWMPTGLLAGLNVQLDWYRIDIDNAITTLSANDILGACYSDELNPSGNPGSAACRLVHRNPDTGGLVGDPAFGVSQANENIALRKTEGFDLLLDYSLRTAPLGHFDISLFGTYVTRNDRQPSQELPVRECAGKYGASCGSPDPQVRLNQRTVWFLGDFEAGYRWRYLKGTSSDNPAAAIPAFQTIDDRHYIDLNFGWKPVRIAGLSVRLGINNVFDKDPPLVGEDAGPIDRNSGNTYPGTFDTLGRSFFANVAKTF